MTAWPKLDTDGWEATVDSLKLWGQIVGKTRLALSPMINHWWQVTFYVSARGLTTSLIPAGERGFEVEMDFIAHQLMIRTTDGGVEAMPLCDEQLSGFYAAYVERLARLGLQVHIFPVAVEIPERIRLDATRASAATIRTGRTATSARWSRATASSSSFAGGSWARRARCISFGAGSTWPPPASPGARPRRIRAGSPTSATG